MQSLDYDYIGTITRSLSGIPTRIYKNNTVIFYHSTVNLVKDPVSIYQADILKITDHVGYFMTAHFCYYGIVNSDNYKIVIGRQARFQTPRQHYEISPCNWTYRVTISMIL